MVDGTSLWVFFQKHKHRLGSAIAGILLFAAGWQTGRVMSPYWAAHPIIFEDQPSSGGTAEELSSLRQEQENTATVQNPTPTVAAAQAGGGENTQQKAGKFVGSVNSDLYHDLSCPSVSSIKEENQIWFASVEEAEAAGYSPSKCTIEKLGLP